MDRGIDDGLLKVARNANNFYFGNYTSNTFLPLICANQQIGLISPQILEQIRAYPHIFSITPESVLISPALSSYDERSEALKQALKDLRYKNVLVALRGWRDEYFDVKVEFSGPALFRIERAACPMFGLRQFGVHINGFTNHNDKGPSLWLQRRPLTEQAWPGRLDTFVGGGLSHGYGVLETAVKEAEEEANVPQDLAMTCLKSAGSVSFFYESARGIFPQTLFVFDLELPADFHPTNNDGEVSGWELFPVNELVTTVQREDFKTTSCPVLLDWLVRRGVIAADDPVLPELVELIHLPLHSLYHTSC